MNQLANIYEDMNNFSLAVKYYQKAFDSGDKSIINELKKCRLMLKKQNRKINNDINKAHAMKITEEIMNNNSTFEKLKE